MSKQDITKMIQSVIGDNIKIDSAMLDLETGIVDVLATPVKPVEYINIIATVNRDDLPDDIDGGKTK